MKRMDESTALGMWDFAAYVISEDQNIASNVANSYLALTQGENSYSSQASVNVWRGDMGEESKQCREICEYLKELRHPMFALNPYIVDENPTLNVYPEIITATTCLSSKELAYSLNFPKKSIAGLPVIECAEFARDVVKYDNSDNADVIELGKVFHMHHIEKKQVSLTTASMASHTFISGSTGSGKSNTIYKIIDELLKKGIPFLVVEPAKGEYKDIFGNNKDVNVFSTNKGISDLLRINPFSFRFKSV